MSLDISIRPAEPEDCAALAPFLRDSDILELETVSGLPAVNELSRSLAASVECWTVLLGETPSAMFGVSRLPTAEPGEGLVWMVASKEAENEALAFAIGKISRNWYREIQPRYERLYNYVDAINVRTIRWLQWLGFRMVRLHMAFAAGRTFWEFDNTHVRPND